MRPPRATLYGNAVPPLPARATAASTVSAIAGHQAGERHYRLLRRKLTGFAVFRATPVGFRLAQDRTGLRPQTQHVWAHIVAIRPRQHAMIHERPGEEASEENKDGKPDEKKGAPAPEKKGAGASKDL